MSTLQKHDLTQATGITADVVLEQGEFYVAKDFRKVQTGLSSAARELRSLVQGTYRSLEGRLGAHLTHEQRELLSNAAALLDSIKYNVEHAKERKAREEKAATKLREQRERLAKQLAAKFLQLPTDTVEQQIEILKLYLTVRRVAEGTWLKRDQQLRDMMQQAAPSWCSTSKWRKDHVSSLVVDLRFSLEHHLYHCVLSPSQRLDILQERIADVRDEELSQPSAQETIEVWTEALQEAALGSNPSPATAPSHGGAA